jgi:hypothetical protein
MMGFERSPTMHQPTTNRRGFLQQVAAAAVAAQAVASRPTRLAAAEPASGPTRLRLGGPVFRPPHDPEELALAHRRLGYRAAYCPAVELKDTDRIRALRAAFARHDVVIAEVGRWCNLLDADPEKRAANLQKVTDGLALAEELGARCCVDIAGSYNPQSWFGPHPDNLSPRFFDEAVENARKIIDAVQPKTARFKTYLQCLAALPAEVPLMIEHMANEAEYDKSREYILRLAKELGLPAGKEAA